MFKNEHRKAWDKAVKKQIEIVDNMDLDSIKPTYPGMAKDIERLKLSKAARAKKKLMFKRITSVANPVMASVGMIMTPKPAGAGSELPTQSDIKKQKEYLASLKK